MVVKNDQSLLSLSGKFVPFHFQPKRETKKKNRKSNFYIISRDGVVKVSQGYTKLL